MMESEEVEKGFKFNREKAKVLFQLVITVYAIYLFIDTGSLIEIVGLIGTLLGILTRTFLPYIRKVLQGKLPPYIDIKYISSGTISFITLAYIAKILIPSIAPYLSALIVFLTMFFMAIGVNSIYNEVIKWGNGVSKNEQEAIAKIISLLEQLGYEIAKKEEVPSEEELFGSEVSG